jgi:hypothetical protein
LITLGGFTFAIQEPVTIEAETFKLTITQVSGFNTGYHSLLPEIAKSIMKMDSNNANGDGYKVESYPDSYRLYKWVITSKKLKGFDYNDIIKKMLDKELIRIDTLRDTKTIRIFER